MNIKIITIKSWSCKQIMASFSGVIKRLWLMHSSLSSMMQKIWKHICHQCNWFKFLFFFLTSIVCHLIQFIKTFSPEAYGKFRNLSWIPFSVSIYVFVYFILKKPIFWGLLKLLLNEMNAGWHYRGQIVLFFFL